MIFGVLKEFLMRWKWSKEADRLGPDMLATHFSFYIPSLRNKICKAKFAYFGAGAEFRIGAYAVNCSNIYLGKNVTIRPNSFLMADKNGEIRIEDDVLIGSGVHIYVSNHRFDNSEIPIFYQGHTQSKSVCLKRGCWIGANVVILPGITIGENAVVGAGSIVTKNIPSRSIVAGNPAKVIKD